MATLHATRDEKLLPTWLVNWLAGISGGLGSSVVGHPFDTVKVRMQAQDARQPLFASPSDCVRQTWGREGPGGFYRGIGSPLVGQLMLRSWQFLSYGKAKELVAGTQNPSALSMQQLFLSGTITGFFIAPVESTVDFFKSQMQIQAVKERQVPGYRSPYRHVFHAFYVISKERGPRGWFQGYPATVVRNCCSCGLYFSTYELARRFFADGGDVTQIGLMRTLAAGSVGGVGYWSLTFPLDSIKSAMQADNTDPAKRKYSSWADCVRKLHAEGGVRRFYTGYLPCMLRSSPANAALFTSYQITANFLNTL